MRPVSNMCPWYHAYHIIGVYEYRVPSTYYTGTSAVCDSKQQHSSLAAARAHATRNSFQRAVTRIYIKVTTHTETAIDSTEPAHKCRTQQYHSGLQHKACFKISAKTKRPLHFRAEVRLSINTSYLVPGTQVSCCYWCCPAAVVSYHRSYHMYVHRRDCAVAAVRGTQYLVRHMMRCHVSHHTRHIRNHITNCTLAADMVGAVETSTNNAKDYCTTAAVSTHVKAFLERHDELNGVQRVRPKVLGERRRGHHLALLHRQLLGHDHTDLRQDIRAVAPHAQRSHALLPCYGRSYASASCGTSREAARWWDHERSAASNRKGWKSGGE